MSEFPIATRHYPYQARRYDMEALLHFLNGQGAFMAAADNTTIESDDTMPFSEFGNIPMSLSLQYEFVTQLIVTIYALDIIGSYNEYEAKFDNERNAVLDQIEFDSDSEIDFVMDLASMEQEKREIEKHLGTCNEDCAIFNCPLDSPNAEQIIKGIYNE